MAQYTFTEFGIYGTGPGGGQQFDNANGGTLNDGSIAPPGQFVDGDDFVLGQFEFSYTGTFDIGGVLYPVAEVTAAPSAPLVGLNALFVEGVALPGNMPPGQITAESFSVCFAEGTEITTASGPVAVETLKVGDTVRTIDGRDVDVKWVGHQTVATRFAPAERVRPVKFAAGSLGGGLPTSDLVVTADHAMLMGDTLCNAAALVNGTTITRLPLAEMGERYTVYHVETADHEIILANGAASETFIDNVSRNAFDNYADFEAMYGDVAEMTELAYPRAMTERQVPAAIKASLASTKVA